MYQNDRVLIIDSFYYITLVNSNQVTTVHDGSPSRFSVQTRNASPAYSSNHTPIVYGSIPCRLLVTPADQSRYIPLLLEMSIGHIVHLESHEEQLVIIKSNNNNNKILIINISKKNNPPYRLFSLLQIKQVLTTLRNQNDVIVIQAVCLGCTI